MANPQKENGHTQIANEILEVIPFFKFNGTQLRMLLVIVRYTYGFRRKEHELSVSFFEKATGITKRQIQKEINNLIENKVIIEISKPSFNTSRKLAFNKNYDEWLIGRSGTKEHSEQKDRGEQLDTSTGELQYTSTGERLNTQERKVKERLKKDDEGARLHPDKIINALLMNEIITKSGINHTLAMDLTDIEENFGFDDFEEMVLAAVTDSARASASSWKYVYNKLFRWKKEGYKKPSDVQEPKINYGSSKKKNEIDWDNL